MRHSKKPAIIIANHQSFIDILELLSFSPKIIMITNHWVWNSPVFGKIIQYAGFFHVDEGYELCVERMREKVREGYSIAIFPEGTRTYDGKMKRFHKGAFYLSETLQLDIIPILLYGNGEIIAKAQPFYVRKGIIYSKILPRILYNDASFGTTYQERTKRISSYMKEEYARICLEKEYNRRNTSKMQSHTVLLGQLLYVALIIACLSLYFNQFRRDYLANTRHILFIASMPVIYPLLTSFLIKHNLFNVYIIPFAMAPIFIRVFMDSRTAFVTHVATVLISAISLKYPYEFIATQLVAGMVAIYSLRELSQRSQLIRSAFYVTLASIAFYMSMELIHGKRLRTPGIWHVYLYYHQRYPLVICLPVAVLVRKGLRLHL